jgi:hypothetical protein
MYEDLKMALEVVLEHHFGDHWLCGPWCPAMYWKDDEKDKKSLNYRCKAKDA